MRVPRLARPPLRSATRAGWEQALLTKVNFTITISCREST